MTETERLGDIAAREQADRVSRRKAAETWAFRDYPELVPGIMATTGWTCPNGHAAVNTLTSRKGRVYGMCVTCHAFEPPVSVARADPKDGDTVTVDEYCALLSEEDAAAYRKGIAQLAREEEEHDAYMRAKPRAANVEPRSRPASPHVQTDDEYCALLSEEDAVTYRKDRANLARAAHEADERFKRQLIFWIVVVIIFAALVASGSLNSWLNAAPDCFDRSCFGGGA